MGALTILLTIGKIILAILAAVLILVLLLLLLPVFYRLEGEGQKTEEGFHGRGRGSVWILFGLLLLKVDAPSDHPVVLKLLGIPVYRFTPGAKKPEEAKKEKPAPREDEQTPAASLTDKIKALIRILQTDASKEALRRGKERILRILKQVLPRRMSGYFRFGMEDPADTGYILGGLSALFSFLPWKVSLLPEFEQEILEGKLKGKGHLVPVLLIVYVVQILTDRYISRFIRRIRKGLKYGR